MSRLIRFALGAGFVVGAPCLTLAAASAAPFVPTDDAQILETGLPNADPRMRQMRSLAGQLATDPSSQQLAMNLAARQLAMGVAEADPRFVGYARGTLARWWSDEPASPALRIMRARILQAQHDFAGATAQLREVLHDEPENPGALLLLASVAEATGEFDTAKDSCARFGRIRPGLTAAACRASVDSQTGESDASFTALSDAIAHMPTTDSAQLLWALTILGEIAVRRDDPRATDYLKQALALDPRNVYALTVYADYLLDHAGAAIVLRLLRGFERIDALYLRLVLAEQITGDPGFRNDRADLASRFVAAQQQGDVLHLRDASRFTLEIEHDSRHALDFAQQNWTTHKSPYDAYVFLAAAIACHDAPAAQPVIDWAARNHLEDKKIERQLQQVEALPKDRLAGQPVGTAPSLPK
ncbi:MAG: tetratricopeptide repeat protein [Alphaproteobacteria bacterium]|nr:tetratricopeptide repeat protein [Alphaproteobacteria bacterium]